jgi:hypothetical protein
MDGVWTGGAQGWHEVSSRKRALALLPVNIGQGCADLPKAKVISQIRQALQAGKSHPLSDLAAAQLLKELVWVSVAEGEA